MAILDLQTLEVSPEAQHGAERGNSGASKGCGGGASWFSLLLC